MIPMKIVTTILAAMLAVCTAGPGLAQTQAPAEGKKKAAAPAPPGWPANAAQSIYLARSTMMALQQAVETGNFTVLRDLGSPGFRAQNTAADLAIRFQALRQAGADLTAVAVIAPQLSTPPFLDPQKQLHLVGLFPTQPLEIDFDLSFENVDNRWRISAIGVTAAPAPKGPDSGEKGKPAK
ncbi:hypothetical protein EN836_26440 [Mesorhizobium sp. M1C.F.Ca.ET.193.01.1.1]|nr:MULTISPECIES: hypothetical protein [unclassified Mesorhizobium]TGR21032.1 hypothetical protein EN839_26435 [Mesorhizobium sp. M1C.F.Ca.ET.196.01.1.1]TGR43750.1 hypothetical protein EN838_26435 [Mesorhizobium sp. M1C.F.Ca.ET.195.01.1.1]TGR77713.1 hypothetical protein EN836_26440 [Mesorhizobium sp. M1C.F.Ca.ET.193.01.1.1]TGS69595.1 hypothetical protein EN819_26440 [Mesorhizobium sp. M1C.F.Ca.ET.176.01.1.1]TGS93854.1 hypothetical protein EN820_47105 [bacterium M00.F.Ca.ET.177.01.1.1]TGU75311.